MLDLLQPVWREVLIKKRPMPNMVVSNALVTTAEGGVARRPDVKVADNLYIVGDEVGKEGLCLIHLLQVQSVLLILF